MGVRLYVLEPRFQDLGLMQSGADGFWVQSAGMG